MSVQTVLLAKKTLSWLSNKKVAVIGHMRPDGDCIGSQVALCSLLTSLNIENIAINPDSVPKTLTVFAKQTPFFKPEECSLKNYEVITVDCADLSRIGPNLASIAKQPFLNIDHHSSNTYFAKHNIVDIEASSTCELLYKIASKLKLNITSYCAQALLLGIATDTGNFMYPSVRPYTHEAASVLIKRGAIPSLINRGLTQEEEFSKLVLLKKFLGSLKLELNNKVCIGTLSLKDYKDSNAKKEQSDGFVDYTRCIASVCIGAFIEINESFLKVSLRAKEPKYQLDTLAKNWGGGGHPCAAGLTIHEAYDVFYTQFLNILKSHLKKIEQ